MSSFRLDRGQPATRISRTRIAVAVAVGVLVFAGVTGYDHFRHGSASSTGQSVAAQAGAESCTDSGYQLVNRLDNSKPTIYNCSFAAGMKCVTVEHGIANDVTAAVKLVWASALGSQGPDCAT